MFFFGQNTLEIYRFWHIKSHQGPGEEPKKRVFRSEVWIWLAARSWEIFGAKDG
jgi:hypothetical protein